MTGPLDDRRATLIPKSGSIFGGRIATRSTRLPSIATKEGQSINDVTNVLEPIRQAGGIIFPYTPVIQMIGTADYEQLQMTHSNHAYNVYKGSSIPDFVVSSTFTAETIEESRYLLSVIHFLKSITKSYFGDAGFISSGDTTAASTYKKAGTPPPVLLFNYLGAYMYRDIPVVVKSFTVVLADTVDYIPVTFGNNGNNGEKLTTNVPTSAEISISLGYQPNPNKARTFDLDGFANGSYTKNTRGFL